MIIDDDSQEPLKQYLITILDESICDADPETLADYVIALLRHDVPNKELKNLCISQLEEFLKSETDKFVNQLFDIIETKAYLPGNSENKNNIKDKSSDLKRSRDEIQEQKEDSDQSDDDRNFKHKRTNRDGGRSSSLSRKTTEEQSQPPNKKYRTDNKSNNKHLNKEQNDNKHQNNRNSYQRNNLQEKNYNPNNDNKLGKRRRNDNDNENSKGSGKYMRNNNDFNEDGNKNYKNNYHQNQQSQTNNKYMNSQKPYQNMSQDFNYMNNGMNNMNNMNGMNNMNSMNNMNNMNAMNNMGNNGNIWFNQNNQNIQALQNNQNRFRNRNQQQQFRNNNGIHPRQRCIDYDEKGYCVRGDMCPFDHGMDKIVLDEMSSSSRRGFDNMMNNNMPPRMMPSMNQNNFNNQFMNGNNIFENDNSYLNTEGYDPEQPSYNSSLGPSQWGNTVIDPLDKSFQNQNNNNNNNNNNNSNNSNNNQIEDQNQSNQSNNDNMKQNINSQNASSNNRGRNNRGRGRGRGAFGFNRHRQSQAKQPILNIENIPQEYFAIDKINSYFKKFGTIININLNPRHYKATIQFSQYSEANQAYNSPDPIFGNRFVKLYWAKTESEENENSQQNEKENESSSTSTPTKQKNAKEEEKEQTPEISSEEMGQINIMKKSMISRQLEKQKALMKQVENPSLTKPEKEEILNNIRLITESVKHIMNASPQHIKILAGNILQQPKENIKSEISTDTTKSTENTEKSTENTKLSAEEQLKEKVEFLKAEAASLGIDPTAITASSAAPVTPSATISTRGRGGFRARGRGLHPWARGGRSFKLDNRPTKLLVKGFSSDNKLSIQRHFEMFGIIEGFYISKDGLSAIVHYQSRREAEQAYIYGKKVEGINDILELSWFSETPDPNLYEIQTQPSSVPGASSAVAETLAQLANKINKINNPENKEIANLSSTLENLSKNTTTEAVAEATTEDTTDSNTNEEKINENPI